MGCHALLQGIFLTQGLNPPVLQVDSLWLSNSLPLKKKSTIFLLTLFSLYSVFSSSSQNDPLKPKSEHDTPLLDIPTSFHHFRIIATLFLRNQDRSITVFYWYCLLNRVLNWYFPFHPHSYCPSLGSDISYLDHASNLAPKCSFHTAAREPNHCFWSWYSLA